MENAKRILDLVESHEDVIRQLRTKIESHQARLSGFKASIAALNGDDSAFTATLKRKLESRINEESDHVTMLSLELRSAESKKTAFDEVVKLLPKSGANGNQKNLRAGSELAKVQEMLRQAGKPLTLDDILEELDCLLDSKKRISLRGSLRTYAKEGRFFTIEDAQDTFGLMEFKK